MSDFGVESTGLFGPSLLCWEKERAKERRGRAAHRTSPADRIFILLPAAGGGPCPFVPSPPVRPGWAKAEKEGRSGGGRTRISLVASPFSASSSATLFLHLYAFLTFSVSLFLSLLTSQQHITNRGNPNTRSRCTQLDGRHNHDYPFQGAASRLHLQALSRIPFPCLTFLSRPLRLSLLGLTFWTSTPFSWICLPGLPIDIRRLSFALDDRRTDLLHRLHPPIYDAEHARVGSDFRLNRYRFGQPPLFSHHHPTVSLPLVFLLAG